jgi:hypothetical protein
MDKKFMRRETVPNFALFRDTFKLMMQQGLEGRTRAHRMGHSPDTFTSRLRFILHIHKMGQY